MLNKKVILASVISLFVSSVYAAASPQPQQPLQTATPTPAATASNNPTPPNQPTLTLNISSPEPMANLAKGNQPNPVYLQYTPNDGKPPIYSDPVTPGQDKTIELKITSPSNNGAQFQIVSSTTGSIQPMSFMYAFTEQRLECLINKNAKITVTYSINTRMMDVEGVPIDC